MTRLRKALGLAAILWMSAAPMTASSETVPAPKTQSFKGWTATCDNLLSCVAIATAQDDLFYVRIARAAGEAAAPTVKLVLASQDPLKGKAQLFRLTAVDGGSRIPLGPFPAVSATDDPSVLSAAISPGKSSFAFIEAMRGADTLDYSVSGTHGTLDLSGLSPALGFIDAVQGRAGTETALVSRGAASVTRVPPAPKPLLLPSGLPGSVSVVDKPVVTKATQDLASGVCDPEVVADTSEAMAWRLASDIVLVAVPCMRGAYNLASALYFTTSQGTEPRAVSLPRLSSDQVDAANVVVNAGFDPKSMELSSLDKGRGLGDCGTSTTWLWTGERFALLAATGLDACPGALAEDWPSLYAARRK